MFSFECKRRFCFSHHKCSKCKYFLDCSSCFYGKDCKFSGTNERGYFCQVNSHLRYVQSIDDIIKEKQQGS